MKHYVILCPRKCVPKNPQTSSTMNKKSTWTWLMRVDTQHKNISQKLGSSHKGIRQGKKKNGKDFTTFTLHLCIFLSKIEHSRTNISFRNSNSFYSQSFEWNRTNLASPRKGFTAAGGVPIEEAPHGECSSLVSVLCNLHPSKSLAKSQDKGWFINMAKSLQSEPKCYWTFP